MLRLKPGSEPTQQFLPLCAGAPAAFSRAGHRGRASDGARLARAEGVLDDRDDWLRPKLAGDVLSRSSAVIPGLRHPGRISSGLAMQIAVSIAVMVAAATLMTRMSQLDRHGPKLF